MEEEAEPGALAAALPAHAVHAVVPVAAADERQAVRAGGQALVDRAQAVLEERAALGGRRAAGRRPPARPGASGGASRNGTRSSRTPVSPVVRDVVRHRVRQPEQVVRAAGARAAAARLVPPVLDVALDELAAGGAQQVLAGEVGPGERAAPSTSWS